MEYSIPIQLENWRYRRGDETMAFTVRSVVKIPTSDFERVEEMVNKLGVIILSESATYSMTDKDIEKVLQDLPKYDTASVKSPSKRYRAILWHVLSKKLNREPSPEEFAKYYDERYEELIDKAKEYLDSEL